MNYYNNCSLFLVLSLHGKNAWTTEKNLQTLIHVYLRVEHLICTRYPSLILFQYHVQWLLPWSLPS